MKTLFLLLMYFFAQSLMAQSCVDFFSTDPSSTSSFSKSDERQNRYDHFERSLKLLNRYIKMALETRHRLSSDDIAYISRLNTRNESLLLEILADGDKELAAQLQPQLHAYKVVIEHYNLAVKKFTKDGAALSERDQQILDSMKRVIYEKFTQLSFAHLEPDKRQLAAGSYSFNLMSLKAYKRRVSHSGFKVSAIEAKVIADQENSIKAQFPNAYLLERMFKAKEIN